MLAYAVAALAANEMTTATLTSEQRAALTARHALLSDILAPARTSAIRMALASLAAMPATAEDDPAKARALFDLAVSDLEGERLPEFALLAAARDFRMHKVPGVKGSWRPTPGALRAEAARQAERWRHEHWRISTVLSAKVEPPRQIIAKERFAELRGLISAVAGGASK